MLTMALFITCYVLRWKNIYTYILHNNTSSPIHETCCEILSESGGSLKNENGQGCSCLKAEREKKPPAERGDLSTFNEEHGSQAVFLQSAPLVSQQDSQHDAKYIKV